jgi:Calcineurin-like phosphoesterase
MPDRASRWASLFRRQPLPVLAIAAATLAAAGWAGATALPSDSVSTGRAGALASTCRVTVVSAGDMNQHAAVLSTGALAQRLHPDVIAALGDEQYPFGSLAQYRAGYDRTAWGQLKGKTRPVPGNHEYRTAGASGYFAYFGNPPRYYGYDIGCGWRGYALNSEIPVAAQAQWLRRDLLAHPGVSVLAYWHRPRYSSGVDHGGDPGMQPFLDALAGRRGVVLNGHEHNYERFAVRANFREFVVGTGGSATYPFKSQPVAGSAKRIAHTPGVLRLTLGPGGSYGWSFVDRTGASRDAGRG